MSPVRFQTRASRYRELAVMDRVNAALLNRLAEEADRGVLCTASRRNRIHLAHNVPAARVRMFVDATRFPEAFV
jgi:hypothetical protein